ncbi:MAG: hypothetical protein VCF07_11015, partial [Nitrospinota bacterium]
MKVFIHRVALPQVTIRAISNHRKLTLATSFAEVPVEMSSISVLELTNPVVKITPKVGEVRARMRARGQLTFRMQS